jgi:predicted amidohydrolase YtcJ
MKLNRQFLDAIFPDKPVALMSKDYHSKLCNSLALKLAGIDEHTPDPYGGKIEHNNLGKPTGVLFETAVALIDTVIEPLPDHIVVQAIRNKVESMHKLGLVGFHSMESRHSRDVLLHAFQLGSRFRLCWHFPVDELEYVASEGRKSYGGDDHYQTGGMKIFGDGSLGSRTAAMFAPYPDEPDNLGILRYTDAELFQLMQSAAQKGFSSTIHAIGNKCVRQVIDATMKLNKQPGYSNLMHRIEHVQSLRNEDVSLLKASGLFASVQPLHLSNDVPMIDAYWHDIEDEVYSFKTMLDAGIPLGFGSDTPIESINPFLGIYSAVERRPFLNHEAQVFRPKQVLNPIQAILGYSLAAAQSSRMEPMRGSIDIGKQADLIVIDDYRKQSDTFWLTTLSQLTMISGTIIHSGIS